ncbi:MAG: bifunctional (p)ppGpp synthetase/guanosine-3',5'-bis(diphosphate) 3'-pyrophosphohydrolase [Patescibacteria group bacterium]|nr:HD domain-containing protein [Patescibacteria group bacterium]MDE1944207.1 bifunctional (p)ppGpp synthetase/guanosine-3',5'-bis(diphosphate) 3'-pyrophosphohydrolase [Patescibacteria group bacterium]MDE1944922.1 bifunctional (p)ppGpp synthetase/guanosine-3',5'-bis(diphosphate) 3'-pyrophosphohydrolase [Patescibacteria group bacterium]MDE2057443.1 bifunctional (p)ppGpp synthetase/guanosine-3',5'-bis(diphosphate) 3'-pyrophosphohydrolase [Patescibacteria group bacterium]
MTSVKEILAGRMGGFGSDESALVEKAYAFAKKAHEGATRFSGEPYFVHPSAVAKTLAEYGMDGTTVAAGLLHDTVEDGHASAEEIEGAFGPDVRFLVEGVTKLGKHKYRGAERHAESLRRLLVATASDVRVLIIKLADRYHNMQTLEHVAPEKRRRIALETLEIYAPIADRLGMGKMQQELADLAFPFVDADACAHTAALLASKTKETAAGLAKMQKAVRRALAKNGLTDFRTGIRIKGLWSLHEKLARKGDDISLIHDIAALRIIVPDTADCYKALSIVHALYKPLPGRFKDYIAVPKPNGYRSLHTTVVTPHAGIVEVQIRSEEMHRAAEFGIASHTAYKELGDSQGAGRGTSARFAAFSLGWARWLIPSLLRFSRPEAAGAVPKVETPRWLAELADAHAGATGSAEFVQGLKEDFFSYRIFVFTPKGDVIDLPAGSTPIDFAYALHSDLGEHLAGAKVNGKMAAIDTKLASGDVVEILRREHAKPSAKWLDMAKTTLARKRIRVALGLTEPDKPPRPKRARQVRHGKKA